MSEEKKVYIWKDELSNLCGMVSRGMKSWEIAEVYGIPEKQLDSIFIILGITQKRVNGKKYKDNKEMWLRKKLLNRSGNKKIPRDKIDDIYESLLPLPDYCQVLGNKLYYDKREGLTSRHIPSLDRVDSSKGYVLDNIAIISWRANTMKSCGTAREHRKVAEFMETFVENKERIKL